jgi:hypothetical protein
MLKSAYFRENFRYDATTGIVTRLNARTRKGVINPFGRKMARGYIIFCGKHSCFAHRIAWFLHYGEWPKRGIDHVNGNKADNRIANLREADQHQNMANVSAYRCNRTGLKGAHYRKDRGKWQSSIMVHGKNIKLGMFASPEAAHDAYCAAAKKYFGEFARVA